MTDRERRTCILADVVNNMALFIRKYPPAEIPENDVLMSLQDFCNCFVDAESDPAGEKIKNYFIMKAYEKFQKNP